MQISSLRYSRWVFIVLCDDPSVSSLTLMVYVTLPLGISQVVTGTTGSSWVLVQYQFLPLSLSRAILSVCAAALSGLGVYLSIYM